MLKITYVKEVNHNEKKWYNESIYKTIDVIPYNHSYRGEYKNKKSKSESITVENAYRTNKETIKIS